MRGENTVLHLLTGISMFAVFDFPAEENHLGVGMAHMNLRKKTVGRRNGLYSVHMRSYEQY